MEAVTLVLMKMEYSQVLGSTSGLMEAITRVILSKDRKRVKEFYSRNPYWIQISGLYMRVGLKETKERVLEK